MYTGDMNAVPEATAIQYLLGRAQINNLNTPIPLYEALMTAGAGGGTWVGGGFGGNITGNKIDYIFTRRDPFTCVTNGKVITDTFDGFSSSDHAVIQSEFCIGTGCTNCK